MPELRLIPYARTSRERGRSPAVQERDYRVVISRWHSGQPGVRLEKWYFDHGKSGGSIAGRKALEAALVKIRAGEADGIVVPEAKRLGRNVREALNLIHEIQQEGALVVPLDVPGADDPMNADAELALTIWLGIAQRELRGYQSQWLERKVRWAEAGGHIGRAPLGYRVAERESGDDVPRLEPNEKAQVVLEAFGAALHSGLYSASHKLGLPPNKALRVLRNPVYTGRTSWRHPTRGPIVVEGAHEALVDPITFRRVQRALDGEQRPTRAPSADYPLSCSEYVICESCWHELVGARTGGKGGRPLYRCRISCSSFAVLGARELEAQIRLLLKQLPWAAWGEFEIGHEDSTDEPEQEALRGAERALEATQAAVAGLDPEIGRAALERAEERLAEAREALDARRDEIAARPGSPTRKELAQASVDELPGFLERAGLSATVSPRRGPAEERVRLIRR
jgi:DNA invertase Pin-like site-specific DNA recombinase